MSNPDTTPARSKRTRERGPPQGEVTPTAPPHTPPGDGRAKGSALRANRRVLQGPLLTPCRPSGNVHGASSNACYRRRRKMEKWYEHEGAAAEDEEAEEEEEQEEAKWARR